MSSYLLAMRAWPASRWLAALAASAASLVLVAVPTDLIDTPVFSRAVPPTWWAWPALVLNSLLMGLLFATYVRPVADRETTSRLDARGGAGGLLTLFAVGCPVCNKLVLLALGTSGALAWFAPVQPVLTILATGLLLWSLDRRLRGELSCPAPALRVPRHPLLLIVVAALVALAGCGQAPGNADARTGNAGAGAGQQPQGPAPSSTAPDERLLSLAHRTKGDPLAMGRVDAPVVMIEWADFQCPFCGKFARETEPALVKRYVDVGVLRIEWRDFPYFGGQSVEAAVAARAAGRQGKFWRFHDAVYALELPPRSGQLTTSRLESIAKQIGVDLAQFRSDLADPALRKAVQADFAEGQQLGISGTPTFLVNGTPLVGAQPLATFRQVIEQAAKQAGK